MKNSEVALLSLVSSLLIAINTSWSKPAKFLVIISSILNRMILGRTYDEQNKLYMCILW